jgi:MFS family permease
MDARLEQLTIRRYLLGMVFQGVWWAGYVLFPFVLAKSLAAPGWLVTLAVTMEASGMLLALYWGQLLDRGGRRRWLVRSGLGGRAVLVFMPLITSPLAFVALLAVVYFFASLVYPAQNGILQANLRADRQGWIFGRGAMVQHVTAAAVGLLCGIVLDRDPSLYRLIYPLMGLAGFVYLLILSRLPRPAGDDAHDPVDVFTVPRLPLGPVRWSRLAGALVTPFREAAATFREDRLFLWFEVNFMIYGLAFMMLVPAVPLFFTEELDLSYQAISKARVTITSLGVALLGPWMGRLMDRFHPVRLNVLSFAALALYPGMLLCGASLGFLSPEMVAYTAFALYAVAMSGINVTWNVGSISFAPPGRGGYYQGVHVAMVGIRGFCGPLIGYAVLRIFGYRELFLVTALILLVSSASSAVLARRLPPSTGQPAVKA